MSSNLRSSNDELSGGIDEVVRPLIQVSARNDIIVPDNQSHEIARHPLQGCVLGVLDGDDNGVDPQRNTRSIHHPVLTSNLKTTNDTGNRLNLCIKITR